MRFRLATDNPSGEKLTTGIGDIFRSLALGPLYRQQGLDAYQAAEQKRALTDSQIGHNLAQTATETQKGKLLEGRPDILRLMAATRAGMSVPEFSGALSERTHGAPEMGPPMLSPPIPGVGPSGRSQALDDAILTLYGPAMATPAANTNWDQLANARGEYQNQGIRGQAVDAATGGNNEMAGVLASILGNKAYEPFTAVGTTGTTLNKTTGEQAVSDEALSALFGDQAKALIGQRKAAAGASGASAAASGARAKLTGVERGLKELDLDAAKAGKPLPSSNKKSSGSTATNDKAYNAIAAAVESDPAFSSADDDVIQAEISRRAARRGMSGRPPGQEPEGKQIDMVTAQSIREKFRAGKISEKEARTQLKNLGLKE